MPGSPRLHPGGAAQGGPRPPTSRLHGRQASGRRGCATQGGPRPLALRRDRETRREDSAPRRPWPRQGRPARSGSAKGPAGRRRGSRPDRCGARLRAVPGTGRAGRNIRHCPQNRPPRLPRVARNQGRHDGRTQCGRAKQRGILAHLSDSDGSMPSTAGAPSSAASSRSPATGAGGPPPAPTPFGRRRPGWRRPRGSPAPATACAAAPGGGVGRQGLHPLLHGERGGRGQSARRRRRRIPAKSKNGAGRPRRRGA